MDAGLGTIIFMGLILKIPVAFAVWLIYWAIKSEPDVAEAPEEDGGQRRRYRREPKRPSGPRRGPHAPTLHRCRAPRTGACGSRARPSAGR